MTAELNEKTCALHKTHLSQYLMSDDLFTISLVSSPMLRIQEEEHFGWSVRMERSREEQKRQKVSSFAQPWVCYSSCPGMEDHEICKK